MNTIQTKMGNDEFVRQFITATTNGTYERNDPESVLHCMFKKDVGKEELINICEDKQLAEAFYDLFSESKVVNRKFIQQGKKLCCQFMK